MKNCPAGQYYCTKSKKCKPIPKGWHVMRSGYLTRDDDDGQKSKKNGNGNGNGHSGANGSSAGNGNGNGNGSNGGGGMSSESFEIDKTAHKAAQKKAKMRNLAKGNTNPNEKAAAEKKAGGPKLYGEAKKLKTNNIPKREMKNINYRYKNLHKKDLTGTVGEEVSRRNKPSAVAKKKKLEKLLIDKEVNKIQKEEMTYQEMIDAGWEMTGEGIWWPPQTETVTEKLSFSMFKKKAAERKPEKAMDAGAKAKRKLARKAHAKYVSGSEDNVPDDIRDHKEYTE